LTVVRQVYYPSRVYELENHKKTYLALGFLVMPQILIFWLFSHFPLIFSQTTCACTTCVEANTGAGNGVSYLIFANSSMDTLFFMCIFIG